MKVILDFSPFYCNGNMNFSIYANDALVYQWHRQEPSSTQHAEFNIDNLTVNDQLRLRFCVEGKDQIHDTKMSNGAIVEDKAIEIDALMIDEFDITQNLFLYEFVTYSNMTILKTKYFGFNGYMDIDIAPNIIVWTEDCKNKLSMQLPSFEEFLQEIMS